ncbi:MAG: DNA polymerase III subunits gamma/tau [Actinomycetota bacterium]
MTRIALYRRWRSQTFGDVVGQDHVGETLQGQIREGRIAHAYLFSGPRGTGKTSTARILAKALNCESGPTPDPCNKCESCRSITEGSSMDVIEIDAASHGGVDDVRELRENVMLAPAVARSKVYIVDEAHMVTTQGWNAFLKTIEEPPSHVVFVFATTEPEKVISTIKSRCQRFDFRRINAEDIEKHLARICAEEGIEAESGALSLIARNADGGMRDALSTLDQLASSGAATTERAVALLGTAPAETLFDLGEALAGRDAAAALRLLHRLSDQGQDMRAYTRQALEHFRALLFMQRVPDGGALIDATDESRARLSAQAERFGPAHLTHVLTLLAAAQAEMRQQAPARLTLELALVRASLPEADTTQEALLSRIERLERMLELGGPVAAVPKGASRAEPPVAQKAEMKAEEVAPTARAKPAPQRKGTRAAAQAPVETEDEAVPDLTIARTLDLSKIEREWPVVLEEIRKRSKSLHALVGGGAMRPVEYAEGTLRLEARYDYHASQVGQAKHAKVFAEAFRTVFGTPVRVRATVAADAPIPAMDPPAPDETAGIPADPVAMLQDSFGAEVIDEFKD